MKSLTNIFCLLAIQVKVRSFYSQLIFWGLASLIVLHEGCRSDIPGINLLEPRNPIEVHQHFRSYPYTIYPNILPLSNNLSDSIWERKWGNLPNVNMGIEGLNKEAADYIAMGNFYRARRLTEKALAINIKLPKLDSVEYCYSLLNLYIIDNRKTFSIDSLYKTYIYSKAINPINPEQVLLLNTFLTHDYLYSWQYDKAKSLVTEFDSIFREYSFFSPQLYSNHLFNRIFYETYKNSNNRAAFILSLKIDSLSKTVTFSPKKLANLYYWQGLISNLEWNSVRSTFYYKKSIRINQQLNPIPKRNIAGAQQNIATNFLNQRKFEKSSAYLESAISYMLESNQNKPSISLARAYLNWGKIYFTQGNWNLAEKKFQKGITYLKKADPENKSLLIINFYRRLGITYLNMGDFQKSKFYLDLTFNLSKNEIGLNYPSTLISFSELARIQFKEGNSVDALNKIKSLYSWMFPYLKHSEKFIHPPIDSINKYEEIFFNLAFLTAEIFQVQAKAHRDKGKILLAIENIEYAEQLLLKRLELIRTESDRFILVEDSYKTYELGMELLHLAYSDDPSPPLLEKALQWMEKSKAFGLKKNITRYFKNSADSKRVTAESLREGLQAEMAIYQEKIIRARISPIMDTLEVFSWEDSLFELTRTYDSLVFRLQNSSSISEMDTIPLNLSELQHSVGFKQQMLSYFISDGTLHRFYIGNKFAHWDTTQLPLTFEQLIQDYVTFFSDWGGQKDMVKDSANLQKFASTGHYLYNLLIPAQLDSILKNGHQSPNSLVFIPDGVLGLLPFDWLVAKSPSSYETQTFGELDLMGNYLPIYMEYAASFNVRRKSNQEEAKYTFGGFAPSYGTGGLMSSERGLPGQRVIDNIKGMNSGAPITELSFNQEETQQISRLLESQTLSGETATRERFKQVAPNYDILHLSMHGYSDKEDPKLSGLIFSPCKEGAGCEGENIREEDLHEAILYAFEIANLDLNARLAVLSACQTGTGKVQKGEGIMSLARAFALAGVPSQIVSLWNVDDQATLLLFTEFYKHLLAGDAKDVSLWKAKQALKVDPKYSHPYFWSAFVLIGDASPMPNIKPARFWQKWGLLIIVVSICAILLAYRSSRAKY